VSNGPDEATGKQRVRHLIDDTIKLLGVKLSIPDEEIIIYDDYTGGGYASSLRKLSTRWLWLLGRGFDPDPVYTGKAMSKKGLIEKRLSTRNSNTVFLHTGDHR